MPLSSLNARQLLDTLPDATIVVDGLGRILYANELFLEMVGREQEEVINENIIHFLHDHTVFDQCLMEIGETGSCAEQKTLFVHKEGRTIPTIKSVRQIRHADTTLALATIRNLSDIDSKNRALERASLMAQENVNQLSRAVSSKERELNSTKNQLEEILGNIHEIIWYIDDATMRIRYVSSAVESVFKIDHASFMQSPELWRQMIHEEDRDVVNAFFAEMSSGESHSIDFRIQRPDGEVRWLNSRVSHQPALQLFIGVTYDITEQKSSQDLVEFLAYHDPLTRLPNREYLKQKIAASIEHGKTLQNTVALLFLDLDNFKHINDSMGHETGDELLVQITERMKTVIPDNAELTRFGGDEFIVLLRNIQDRYDIERCGGALLACFAEPFYVRGQPYFITTSIGIALCPDHAGTPTDLIKHADTAMYAAKRSGKNAFKFYHPQMEDYLSDFFRKEQLIREGIRHGYFRMYFQPFVDASSHRLCGFEALLRFEHPENISLSAGEFIPIAEKSGDILKLGDLVFEQSCTFAKRLKALTGRWMPVSINLSARQFQDDRLLGTLKQYLHTMQIPALALGLEVTESVIMQDIGIVRTQLQALRKAGFTIALDDFGTGYSSLEYLAKLPIDRLKIDKSFVRALFESPQNEHLVKAIITMAKAMDMKVTAEGIETEKQADFLMRNGAETLQGHLFSPALPPETVERNVREKRRFFTPESQKASVL